MFRSFLTLQANRSIAGEKRLLLCSLDAAGSWFMWPFLLAGVNFPNIGMNFLQHFGLLVDPSGRWLVDPHACQSLVLVSGRDMSTTSPVVPGAEGVVVSEGCWPPANCGKVMATGSLHLAGRWCGSEGGKHRGSGNGAHCYFEVQRPYFKNISHNFRALSV
jgi:hypothetical protein